MNRRVAPESIPLRDDSVPGSLADRAATLGCPRVVRKYLAYMKIAVTDTLASRSALCAEGVLLFVLIGVFSNLWDTLERSGVGLPASPRALVWYVATTEWTLISMPRISIHLEGEIRRGDIVPFLVRPASYLAAAFARAIGALAVRAPAFGLAALAGGLVFGKGPPENPAIFVYIVPFGIGASVLAVSYNLLIGLGAFWLYNVRPIEWIWQKLLFVLGGLMLPLDFCPDALQWVAAGTPFPSILYGPASFFLHPDSPNDRGAALGLRMALWLALSVAAAAVLFRRACIRLEAHGG